MIGRGKTKTAQVMSLRRRVLQCASVGYLASAHPSSNVSVTASP